jgi:hypothetical protein
VRSGGGEKDGKHESAARSRLTTNLSWLVPLKCRQAYFDISGQGDVPPANTNDVGEDNVLDRY